MWVMLSNSFLSIVALQGDHADPLQLLVRARVKGDIEQVFPQAVVTHTPNHDYAYRTTLPRTKVATVLAATVKAIDYPNFKNSVADRERHDAYVDCWVAMHELQKKKGARKAAKPNRSSRFRTEPGDIVFINLIPDE